MEFLGILIALFIIYALIGVVVQAINCKAKDDPIKIEWGKVLKWPKQVF